MIKSLLKKVGANVAGIVVRSALNAMLSDQKVPPRPVEAEDELDGPVDFGDQVKVFHREQIFDWIRFPAYEEANLITFKEYQSERRRVLDFRFAHRAAFEDREKLRILDRDELVECETHCINIPGSLLRRHVDIALPPSKLESVVVNVSEGQVVGGKLRTLAGLWSRTASVTYRCRSRVWHAEEIETIRARLLTLPEVLVREIEAIEASRYNDPLLFISHRWESPDHPDPDGRQLNKLKRLEHCFMIYDYTSFPQVPSSRTDVEGLRSILDNMHLLLCNVVILASPDYTDRGWCVYEYIVACLTKSIVCDEVQDPRFVALRNWVATRAPPAQNAFHDGHEALSTNFISQALLGAVNELASLVPSARFSLEKDRSTVKRLLLKTLRLRLPKKRDYDPQSSGESSDRSWSDEELEGAFDAKLPIPSLQTTPTDHFEVIVPSTLDDASNQKYFIEVKPYNAYEFYELTSSPFHKIAQFFVSRSTGRIAPS